MLVAKRGLRRIDKTSKLYDDESEWESFNQEEDDDTIQ